MQKNGISYTDTIHAGLHTSSQVLAYSEEERTCLC